MCRILLQFGADVNHSESSGYTTLMTGAHRGPHDSAASDNGREDVCEMLLDHGADPNARSHKGFFALYFAAQRCVCHGADVAGAT